MLRRQVEGLRVDNARYLHYEEQLCRAREQLQVHALSLLLHMHGHCWYTRTFLLHLGNIHTLMGAGMGRSRRSCWRARVVGRSGRWRRWTRSYGQPRHERNGH